MDRGCVNCDKFDVERQIQRERDLAIQQLKELGYGLGEKMRTKTMYYPQVDGITPSVIEPSAQRKGKIIIRSNMLDGEDCYCSECDHWALLPDYKFCPYCGVAFEDVITEGETMEEFMYGQDMGNPEDGRL